MTSRWLLAPFIISLMPLAAAPERARADDYPARNVAIIVPFTPAGSTDILARMCAQALEAKLGKTFVVENRPGAGQQIGVGAVAKAEPDGYTLLMATSSAMGVNPTLYKKIAYDPVKDFAPIAMVAHLPFILLVNPALPVNSVAELMAYAKANPGKLSYGSGGIGASHHLYGELFNSLTGTKMTHVPYKGTVPALNDLIAGHIQVLFADLPPALPQVKAGKARALGVTTAKRIAVAPEIPPINDTVKFRHRALADADGTARHARAGGREAAQGDRRLHRDARRQEEADRHGTRAGRADQAGRACDVRCERGEGLGQDRDAGGGGGDRVRLRCSRSRPDTSARLFAARPSALGLSRLMQQATDGRTSCRWSIRGSRESPCRTSRRRRWSATAWRAPRT